MEGSKFAEKNLDKLERWISANLIKFNMDKCILHLPQGNLQHRYSQGDECIETRPVEKDSEVLVDIKLNMNWQCELTAQKTKSII